MENNGTQENGTVQERLCSDQYPKTEVFYKAIKHDPWNITLLAVDSVIFLVTVGIIMEVVVYTWTRLKHARRRNQVIVMLSLCPVISGTSLLILFVPRLTVIGEFVASIYLSSCVFVFVTMVMEYIGKESDIVKYFEGEFVSFRSPPCCCCCLCACTTVPVTKKNLKIIKTMVLQVAIIRPILLFLAAGLWLDEKYDIGQDLDFRRPGAYIDIVNLITTLFGIYGLLVTYRMFKPKMDGYRIISKNLSLQLCLILTSLQSLVFRLLGKNDIPGCTYPLGSVLKASRGHYYLLIIEMMVLAVVFRRGYRHVGSHADVQTDIDDVSVVDSKPNNQQETKTVQEQRSLVNNL